MKNALVRAGLTLGLALAASLFTSGTAKAQIYDCDTWSYGPYYESGCATENNCLGDNVCWSCGNDPTCQEEVYTEDQYYCYIETCS